VSWFAPSTIVAHSPPACFLMASAASGQCSRRALLALALALCDQCHVARNSPTSACTVSQPPVHVADVRYRTGSSTRDRRSLVSERDGWQTPSGSHLAELTRFSPHAPRQYVLPSAQPRSQSHSRSPRGRTPGVSPSRSSVSRSGACKFTDARSVSRGVSRRSSARPRLYSSDGDCALALT